MTEAIKATRAKVQVGSIEIDGFMLPDGSYRMSQTQAAECVGKPEINARRFLSSKALKALLSKDYTPDAIEIQPEEGKRGQSRFNALNLDIVTVYWIYQCYQGNKEALNLVVALATESLERRFDAAFGIARTEAERNEKLTTRIQQLEKQLEKETEDAMHYLLDIESERDYFRDILRQHGIDPYEVPKSEDS